MTAAFRTAARYLGVQTAEQAAVLLPLLSRAESALMPEINFQQQVMRFPVSIQGGRFTLSALPPVESPQLCRLFENASEGLAAAVTLGAGVDNLIKRLMLTDPALGAAVSALASAYADEGMEGVMAAQQGLLPDGLCLSPRFSPGYGDLPLSYQKPLTDAMACWRIGIRLTESCLMLPEKSITALCAIRGAGACGEHLRNERACDRCPMTNCPYREVME